MLQSHYIRVSYARPILFFAIGLILAALAACSNGDPPDDGGSSSSGGDSPIINSSSGGNNPGTSSSGGNNPGTSSSGGNVIGNEWPFDSSGENLTATPGLNDLNLENAITIKYKNGSAPEISNSLSDVKIDKTGENVVVTIPDGSDEYIFVLSGATSNGSFKLYGDARKRLYLNGINITNSNGPAINIQGSKRVLVHLVNGTQNFLTDGPNYTQTEGEQAKGTFFSEGKLNFEGSGSLEVKGKYNHAIVADNDFEISNGKIIVSESVNDGIHANSAIEIGGGVLIISSTGDAIQSEKNDGKVLISGGKIKAQTTGVKSHGIASEGPVSIYGSSAVIQINTFGNGSKGIRSRGQVIVKNGKTSIKTSGTKHTDPGDSSDESNAAGIKLAGNFSIQGGELTIKSLGNEAKGINVEKDATIEAGKIDIEADDNGIRVHGTLRITGGTGSIKSKKQKAINADVWDKNKGSLTVIDGGS